ncbi:single-stranded DNA-binding protein [Streptomyces pinistramenti]|uniref:single-stranded DNA-binding protein n=1 Tax=Streptomyces pinistramenti TaxID=2884812 RepID=UPI001D096628|nr:single-stranded DNA-binding protein [Streptomyces pinistramenti]MCB5911046.1 single-stranded DNA-binding protein [Streptomyces pinistramenti]
MNDTLVTLVGNAATAVEHRQTAAGVAVARFRLAATPRRWDKARERWTDGETSFYTVRAWRALADHVAASVAVGEPLLVQGRLRLREGEQPPERGGARWFAAEVDALAIGHDLSRGTAAFRRSPRGRTDQVPIQQAQGGRVSEAEGIPDAGAGAGAPGSSGAADSLRAADRPPADDPLGAASCAEGASREGSVAGEGAAVERAGDQDGRRLNSQLSGIAHGS